MTWPEQDPHASQPSSSSPYQANPQSGPPAGAPQDPYPPQYPPGQPAYPPPQGQYPPAQPQYPSTQQPYPPVQGQCPPGYAGYGYQAPNTSTNTMAILSLVLAFVFAPAGIVCGHIAKRQIRQTGEQGSGLATAGLVIGYIWFVLGVLFCGVYVVAIVIAAGNSTRY